MSQPSHGPVMSPPATTAPTRPPPYPYPYYPGYAPPPPPRKESDRAVIIVVVVIVVAVVVIIGVGLYIISTMFRNVTSRPFVSFGVVSQLNGNASFRVDSVSAAAAASNYRIRLMIGPSTGSDQPLAASSVPATEPVNGVTFLITWVDADSSGSVTVGDSFHVSGNGVALPAGQSFVFYLDWANGGFSSSPSGIVGWGT